MTKVTDSITLNLNVFLRSLVTAVGIIVFMATLKCVSACVLVLYCPLSASYLVSSWQRQIHWSQCVFSQPEWCSI